MNRSRKWLVGLSTLLAGRVLRRRREKQEEERIVPAGAPERRAENLVVAMLILASLFALGFVVVYAMFGPEELPNELLGICLGMSLACIAGAFTIIAKRLIVTEEIEEDYPSESPEQQEQVAEIVRESGSRITRKKLLMGAGAATAGCVGLAALAPAASIGPIWDTGPLDRTPWRRGLRLVDETGALYKADDIETGTFYTAFPEGADPEDLASPVVVVRLAPSSVHLPKGREGWAPEGILAYSKICTHAGCAIGLYRKPTFPAVEPEPALVCPCHYSAFNPATGAQVIYGPAGRPLPQLPLMIDARRHVRAAGNFSDRVGPGWLNVLKPPTQG